MRTLRLCLVPSILLALGALAAGCGGAQQGGALSYGESARRDYQRAFEAFEDHDCLTASPLFQAVARDYPYSRYAALAELRRADCELDQQHYTEAIRQYRAFIRQRPTHAEVDYANYQVAVCYHRQIPQDFFLSPPREERDQAPTRSALRVVRRFLHDFPESEHVEDAQRVERDVLALLARHELYVASFYLGRDRPQAAVMRIETLLANYSGSGVEPEAMLLLGRVYLHMRDRTQAQRAFEGIITDFPESGFATQARDYLRELGMPSVDAPPSATEPEPEPEPEPVEEEEELEEEPIAEEPIAAPSEETEETGETEEQLDAERTREASDGAIDPR